MSELPDKIRAYQSHEWDTPGAGEKANYVRIGASPWIPVSENGTPQEDGDYLIRVQQIGGDDWFYMSATRNIGIWDTLISEDNWTHYQPIADTGE